MKKFDIMRITKCFTEKQSEHNKVVPIDVLDSELPQTFSFLKTQVQHNKTKNNKIRSVCASPPQLSLFLFYHTHNRVLHKLIQNYKASMSRNMD